MLDRSKLLPGVIICEDLAEDDLEPTAEAGHEGEHAAHCTNCGRFVGSLAHICV